LKEIDRIKEVFNDFEIVDQKDINISDFNTISAWNYNPPSYIVVRIFLNILKMPNYGPLDKVRWHTFFRFNGKTYMIRDTKFDYWSLESNKNEEIIQKDIDTIKWRILKAARYLDKVMIDEIKSVIDTGKFYINNVYLNLESLYFFYQGKLYSSIKRLNKISEDQKNTRDIEDRVDTFNKSLELENESSYYTFALINSFFACLEFILDVFFVFDRKQYSYVKFKQDDWKIRFKRVFSLSDDRILKIYNQLVHIKDEIRNPLTHGLNNENNLLVPLSGSGLVPVSYHHILNKINYKLVLIGKAESENIFDTFKRFFHYITHVNPYRYYILYTKFNFPIPHDIDEINKIKTKMTNYQEFKQSLIDKARFESMVINREI